MTPEKKVEPAPLVPPFVRYVASAIPMVFDDSLSYYECLAALTKYLQDIVKVINNNGAVTEEYIALTKELKEYVENYFANLDVQEEINNKLDAMVEAGTLQEIIGEYLQSNVSWTFDTVADMKNATNLVAGSYANTLGFYEIGDGGAATYYITDSGTADEKAVIAVGDLFANLLLSDVINVKQFGAHGDGETDDTSAIHTAITHAKTGNTIIFPTATYLCNIYCNKALHFDFKNSKLISKTTGSILALDGTKSSSGYILTSPVVRGDRQLTLQETSPITLQAGDYIMLMDDTLRFTDQAANINQEVHQIESIADNVITLRDFVRLPKAIATDTANVFKIDMLEGIEVKNLEVYDDTHDSTGVLVNYCKNVKIENITSSHMNMPSVYFNACVNVEVNNFSFEEPQTALAGKGYGIVISHGTNSFTIRNGKGNLQRHLIDCSSCFDGHVENVIATNSQSTAFVLSHNGFSSDITVDNCVSDSCDWWGFGFGSQGVEHYYDTTAYNFKILNCTAYIKNETINSMGCYFQSPAQDCVIENFKVIGETKNSYGIGIRLKPINNRIIVNNASFEKLARGVFMEEIAVAESDGLFYNRFTNIFINNCTNGFRFGNVKEVFIDKVYCNICSYLIELGAYESEKINPLKFFNLTNGIFNRLANLIYAYTQYYEASTYLVGKINNINLDTAEGNYNIYAVEGGKILNNITALFARCSNPEGIIVPIKTLENNAVTLDSDFLINGFTLYQTVTIINYGSYTINLPHSTKIQNVGGTSFALTAGSSTKYIWNGVNWHQVA